MTQSPNSLYIILLDPPPPPHICIGNSGARRVPAFLFLTILGAFFFFACENPYVRELLRAPVHLESVRVTTDLWQNGQPPSALSPEFSPNVTKYEITVPYDTKEVYFRGSPRFRASVRYAAADGSPALREGVFSYDGIYEPRVFTVTAWEQYMDDTVYTFTVKRELPQDELRDMMVRYSEDPGGSPENAGQGLKGFFSGSLSDYEADIDAEANAVIALVRINDHSTLTGSYADGNAAPVPVVFSERIIGSTSYQETLISFPKGTVYSGTLTLTTVQPGMNSRTYTLKLLRVRSRVKLGSLVITPQGNGSAWSNAPAGFDGGTLNYTGEINSKTTQVFIKAEPDAFAPPGSEATYSVEPVSALDVQGGGGVVLDFPLNKYTVSIKVTSGDLETMDNNLYTVTINKEGVYQVVTDADAELKVRVQTGGGLEV
ncbi:MAG: hypothetical protein LBK27_09055, partial [Treponema sp.]|nr:hypothetical protein [Treponema sp.]